MPQVKVKLAEGQTDAVYIGSLTITSVEAEHDVSDEVLAQLEADERVSVERIEATPAN